MYNEGVRRGYAAEERRRWKVLLKFRAKNYKSFHDEFVFSMEKDPGKTGLEYSILKEKVGSKNVSGLSTSVVYGANAAGKSNVIGAIDTMKSIVLRGNIRDADNERTSNPAAAWLSLIPTYRREPAPTEFGISFTQAGSRYEYWFSVDLGPFMAHKYARKILSEGLLRNGKTVFERTGTTNLNVGFSAIKKTELNGETATKPDTITDIALHGLADDELFLCNGFKTIISKKIAFDILDWFDSKLIVIFHADNILTASKIEGGETDTVYINQPLTEAAKIFGMTADALGYKPDADGIPKLCSILEDKNIAIKMSVFESFGTLRFVREFPLVLKALASGGALIADEFDASIHSIALMNLITIFHNDELNRNHAQLIFNTHNPIFLDKKLFRRDEIKFVERDSETNESKLYALSDFKTMDGTRKDSDFQARYLAGAFGAIREDIDFSGIIRALVAVEEGAADE